MPSRAEIRRQIVEHLRDPLTAGNTDASVARFFGVSPGLVKKARAEVEAEGTAYRKGSLRELPLSVMRLDEAIQSRANLNKAICREYRDAMKAGAIFPPISVVYDGQHYWVWDGFHRTDASRMARRETIRAEVRQGTRRDAVLLAAGANTAHGMRRTNEDKRNAVEHLLRDQEWGAWSNEEIGRRCGVTSPTVAAVRKELEEKGEIDPKTFRVGGDGRTINAAACASSRPSANGAAAASLPPMAPPRTVDHRVSVTLHGDDEADAASLLGSNYPREKLRRLVARLLEHFDERDGDDSRPFKPDPSHLRLLERLREGPAPLGELEEIGGNRYAARFWELRRAGYNIAKINGNAYELVSEPV